MSSLSKDGAVRDVSLCEIRTLGFGKRTIKDIVMCYYRKVNFTSPLVTKVRFDEHVNVLEGYCKGAISGKCKGAISDTCAIH